MPLTTEQLDLIQMSQDMVGGVISAIVAESEGPTDAASDARLATITDYWSNTMPAYVRAILEPQTGDNFLPVADRIVVISAWVLFGDPDADIEVAWGDETLVWVLSTLCATSLDLMSVRLTIRGEINRLNP